KSDLERRLCRETDKVKVLEDLVAKMEIEIERSTMNVKSNDRMSLDMYRMSLLSVPREESEDEDESVSPTAKHHDPGSPVKTLFAEMANVDEEFEDEIEETGQYSVPQSPESSVTVPSITSAPSVTAQVLQSLRETTEVDQEREPARERETKVVEKVERAIQT